MNNKKELVYLDRLMRPEEVVFKAAVTSASALVRDSASADKLIVDGLSENVEMRGLP